MAIDTVLLDYILQNFVEQRQGFQAAALIESDEGDTITTPIRIDDQSTRDIVGPMLYLATQAKERFNWKILEHITLECAEGYFFLVSCSNSQKYFLLVKANKNMTRGFLISEINRVVDKLKKIFDVEDDDNLLVKPKNDEPIIPSKDNLQNNENLWHIPPEDKRVR